MTTTTQQALLNIDNSEAMQKAVASGVFYAEVTPCISGYALGSSADDNDEPVPFIHPTLSEANTEHQEVVDEYNIQIKNGERDQDDAWEGVVMKVLWDGGDDISLVDIESDSVVHIESWKSLSGIE